MLSLSLLLVEKMFLVEPKKGLDGGIFYCANSKDESLLILLQLPACLSTELGAAICREY